MKSRSSPLAEIRRARPLLGTFVEIAAPSGAISERAVGRAFAAIAKVQKLMSAHDAASDLGRLCRARPGSSTKVHRWTWRVLRRAQCLHRATGGAFDPIAAARFGIATARLPAWSRGERNKATWDDVKLLSRNRVRLVRPVRFDLGGIAKGFAVDRATAVLRAAGLEFGLVNAGGDMRAFGGREWPVVVRRPEAPGEFVALGFIRDGAVATSGSYFSRQTRRGKATSALFNPVSTRSAMGTTSATVFGPTCLAADALAKAVLFHGDDRVLRTHRARGVLMSARKGTILAV